jgi:ATP-binding cassette, subfamily B, bacterial
MRLLLSYIRRHRWLTLVALVLAAINQVFSLLDPLIFRHIIDTYVARFQEYSQQEFLKGVGVLLAAAVGVAFVSRVAKNFQDYVINVITQRVGAAIYSDGLRHSLALPYAAFEDQRSGETLGILQKCRTDVERLISAVINILFTTLVGVVFVMVYAFSIHWLIAPVYFSAVPILGWLSSVLSRRIKRVQKSIVSETAALAGSTTESLRNIELIKSLGLASQEIARLNGTTDRILALELRKVKYIRSLSFVQGTVVNAVRTLLLGFMLYLIFAQEITFGQFFSLWIYSFFLFGPLQSVGDIINIYREAEISLENFEQLMQRPVEERPAHPVPVTAVDTITFDHVSFRHAGGTAHALREVDFTARRGETIAFVGPSGAGKTTLIKLLVGLYRPADGVVAYNGVAGTEIDLDALRARIGLVSQDTQLFSGSIRENLLFVNPHATDDEVLTVLRQAACDTLLARADRGLDSLLGENGVKVSGGEKQRLSIARALLRRPDLLVFDEATSALDSLTEEDIASTIRDISARGDMITVLIAHRLSTVMHADTIHVLERGAIVESGTHDDLVARKGLYYAMWRQQVGEAA